MANIENINVPDLGGATDVDVIEILVKPGDTIAKEDSLITLESDKASMEIPAPLAGVVKAIKVKVGAKVNEGDLILTLETSSGAIGSVSPEKIPEPAPTKAESAKPAPVEKPPVAEIAPAKPTAPVPAGPVSTATASAHAGPAVRRYARELGVDLSSVIGSGQKGRILTEDVTAYVKSVMQAPVRGGMSVNAQPSIDFVKFGPIETQTLPKIKRLTGVNVHRSWVTVPHVTQFDEADITEMEAFRKAHKQEAADQGFKLTPLVFLMKAVVAGLQKFARFNASLDPSGEQLILKKYFHIGIAVDTPNGLVVPVVRDVNQKSLYQLAQELADISHKARTKGLSPAEMQGSCFTISSLGGISGTAFTPIVNMPDVAILGVSKALIKPVYQGSEFVPRLILPLSLSYDHRVIDGAEAARFTAFLGQMLGDIRRLLL